MKPREFDGNYSVSPARVDLRLSGLERVLSQLQLGNEQVYLDLKGLGPGQHNVPLSIELPDSIKVVEQRPSRFRVRITDSKRS